MGFGNEYDGHTLELALNQHEQLTARLAKSATVDQGYQDKSKIGEIEISILKALNNKKLSRYKQIKLRKGFKWRAAIEPAICHLKSDYRLGRNFYKGIFGDNINIMLAAAAFNFKRMCNKYKTALLGLLFNWFNIIPWAAKHLLATKSNTIDTNQKILKLKLAF